MEAFSRILPISKARFTGPLRDSILSTSPLVFEEDLNASYVFRQPGEYTHNATRAAIAITQESRLVVLASGAKKIDVPMADPRWIDALSVTSDKPDRIIFKVKMGVLGAGTVGSSLEIRVRTKEAGRIVELAETARAYGRADGQNAVVQQPSYNQSWSPETTSPTDLGWSPGMGTEQTTQRPQRGLSRKPVPGKAAT